MTLCDPSTYLQLLKTEIISQISSKGVDVVVNFFDWVGGKRNVKAEITITNMSNKIAKITVSDTKSSGDFTKIGPRKSITFDLNVDTALYYVSIVVDPDGKPDEVCRNHPCKLGRFVDIDTDGTISVK